jgi:hypothetical protein
MTVEVIENFDSVHTVEELVPQWTVSGAGVTDQLNVAIKRAAGPTFMSGQPQSPRNPPSTLFFKGRDTSSGSNDVLIRIYDDTLAGATQSELKQVAFNFKPVSGERNGAGGDTVAVILVIYAYLALSTPAFAIRINHSLELFDPPDNGFPGGGVGLSLYRNGTGSSTDLLWDSLSDITEEEANEAGLYYAAGNQNGAFFEYGQWYHIELRAEVNGSASRVEFRVYGVTLYKNDSVTLPADTGRVERITMNAGISGGTNFYGSGFSYEVTDIVVSDWSTGFTGWTFPAVVDTVRVNTEVVGEIDFTPSAGADNAAMIDEKPHDFDTTYNESTTVGHKDRFSTTQQVPYTAINGDVYALKVQAMIKDTAALGTRQARVVAYENVTEGVGSTITLPGSGFSAVSHVFPLNPDTSALWTKAEVNGCEIGYEIVT